MARWKIRPLGQELSIAFEVNPTEFMKKKSVEVNYEALTDGSRCRVVAPIIIKKEEFPVAWANVSQNQLDLLQSYLNEKVELIDHLGTVMQVYIDGVSSEYIVSGTEEQRYSVTIKVKEV